MINFVIIDDDKEIRDKVEATIYSIINKSECSIYSAEKITDAIERLIKAEKANSVFILDIELNNEYDGIEIASIIRNSSCKQHEIIFLTNYVDYAYNVLNYKINPIAFIKKDSSFQQMLKNAIKEAVIKIQAQPEKRKIIVKKGSSDIEINENDILYVQKIKCTKSLNITSKLYCVNTIENLESFEKRIGRSFIKVDRSTIINYIHIKAIEIKDKKIIMSDNKEFYVDSKTIKRVMEFDNDRG